MIIPEELRLQLAPDSMVSEAEDIPSTRTLKWGCAKNNDHIWETTLYNKSRGSGCSICSNRKIAKGINDFATTHPEMVEKYWSYNNPFGPDEITSSYSKKLLWKCDLSHEYEAKMCYKLQGVECSYCSGVKVLKGFNDAATIYPHLISEVSQNSEIQLDEITKGSTRKVLWVCKEGHEYLMSVPSRIRGRGCSICQGKVVAPGINDLATLFPTIALEWSPDNSKNPTEVTKGSNYRARWICNLNSEHVYEATVYKRTRDNGPTGCPYCDGKKILSGERDLLSQSPKIAAEYSSKNPIPVNLIANGSSRQVIWEDKFGHEWETSVKSRVSQGYGCPICSNRKLLTGFNDLNTLYPTLAQEFDTEKNNCLASEVVGAGKKYYWWKCKLGHSWKARIENRYRLSSGCPTCAKHVSRAEQEVADFMVSLLPGESVVTSDRSVLHLKELDIYIPSRNLAVEFNGLYWHSEAAGKGRNYHREKWEACKSAGIQLIQIWEDEWRDKKEIVQSMLAHKLGVSQGKHVFARKTEVSSILKAEAEEFLNKYHIQGFVSGSYYLGLRPKGSSDLVSVMVLRKNGNLLYLDRYATNCSVVGGQGKLLSWAHENIDFSELVTFADLQVSDGGLYEATGWVKDSYLRPDYRYLVNGERIHKFNYRLNRFRTDTALDFEEGKSERELAELNGIPRVWDTGKIRYVMPRKS